MSSYQRVVILGNMGQDPEVKYTGSGVAVTSISVATSRKWKDKQSGEAQEETEWHRIVAYDRLAEIIGEYGRKGKTILVEGRLKTRKWEDKDGVTRYTTEIVCESMQLVGKKDDDERPARREEKPRQAKPSQKTGSGFDDMDDDIPF